MSKVETALRTGVAPPEFSYHRFWSQTAIAAALADYDRLFDDGTTPGDTEAPSAPTGLKASGVTSTSRRSRGPPRPTTSA